MKNKVVYGSVASGKTQDYFIPEIKNWKGKTIAISFTNEEIEGFKIFNLDSPDASLDEIFSYNKIYLETSRSSLKSNALKDIVTYLIENITSFKEPVLFAIDGFAEFRKYNLSGIGESLMLNLLKSDKINTLFIMQSLKDLKTIFKNDYEDIVKLSDVICTNEYEQYSGELRVRFPKSLHKYLKEESDKEGVSLNQYIVYQLTKGIN
jgi:predicted HicB family RNase H-like nuclease